MADQQNPIQNDDLLGDIDLNIPAAPVNTDPAKDISDIGNLLVEQSIDTTQTKAETTTASSAPTDPTVIDLGDINLPANEEIAVPTPAPIADIGSLSDTENNTTPASSPELPTEHMFKSEPVVESVPEATPTISVEEPTISEPQPATEQPAVVMPTETMNEVTPAAEETSTPVSDSIVSENETIVPETPSEPETLEIPNNEQTEVSPATVPTTPEVLPTPEMTISEIPNPIELPLPVEQTDPMIDTLMSNEQTQVVANAESTPDEMSFDLDSLTSDLTPKATEVESTPTTTESAPSSEQGGQPATTLPADIIPVVSSVTLPQATLVQPVAHGSAKKKAFAMVAAFLMLLVAGGFVFKTMMPEESDKLLASILGGSPSNEQAIETPEVATEQPTTDEISNLVNESENNTDDTTALTEGDTNIEIPADDNNEEITIVEPTGEVLNEEAPQQPETATTTISLGQAQTTTSLIVNNSKKLLALAIKYEEKQASQTLYKIFKDSSYLAEMLANTNDISTIPNVETQIADMQKSLTQATIIVNVAGSKHTGAK